MKVVNVRISDEITSKLDHLSNKHGITRSEIIRQSLVVYLHIIENVGTLLRPITFKVKPSQIVYSRRGDVSILKIPTGHSMVIGSTSSGGVGPKVMDQIKVEGKVLGKFLARVALMDVAATGAFPLLISATLGVEKEPTGHEILMGIRNESQVLGLEPNQILMENTEDNFKTVQTGVGLTVIGLANDDQLRVGKTHPGDLLLALGKPRIGDEVVPSESRGEIANLRDVTLLSQKRFVHDIVTVGSNGIANEARMLANGVGRQLKLRNVKKVDLHKSAGPATVVLFTVSPEKIGDISSLFAKPLSIIGEIL